MAKGVGGIGPANIMKHLKGVHFPVNKDGIIELVKRGIGPDTENVMTIVQQLPEKDYISVADIMKEIGKIE